MTTRQASLDLLNAAHDFPAAVMFKVIGRNEDRFTQRVVAAVEQVLGLAEVLTHRVRTTAGGRHVAVTVEPVFESAEQVLEAYAHIREVEGVVLVL